MSEHVVAFDYYDDWNWLVGCMARSDEFFAESARTRNYLILATLVIIVLAALAIHLCGRAWISRPLERAEHNTRRLAVGDLSERLVVDTHDEIGGMLHSIS